MAVVESKEARQTVPCGRLTQQDALGDLGIPDTVAQHGLYHHRPLEHHLQHNKTTMTQEQQQMQILQQTINCNKYSNAAITTGKGSNSQSNL